MNLLHERCHIREKRGFDLAGGIPCLPYVTLECLEIGHLDVSGDKVPEVGLKSCPVIAILFREGIAILCELRVVPLLFQ
jgi:hypothetical protein